MCKELVQQLHETNGTQVNGEVLVNNSTKAYLARLILIKSNSTHMLIIFFVFTSLHSYSAICRLQIS